MGHVWQWDIPEPDSDSESDVESECSDTNTASIAEEDAAVEAETAPVLADVTNAAVASDYAQLLVAMRAVGAVKPVTDVITVDDSESDESVVVISDSSPEKAYTGEESDVEVL